MSLENYRRFFLAGSLALIIIAASPTLMLAVSFPASFPKGGTEAFSELWVLGPNGMAKDYPFNVRTNQSYTVFVGVGNHLGSLSYYLIYLKLRNETQPLPNSEIYFASPLDKPYEFRTFIRDGEASQTQVTFSFTDITRDGAVLSVNQMVINNETFTLNSSSLWDSKRNGFYYQLLFELWRYDSESGTFTYDNRFVDIWLNVTV